MKGSNASTPKGRPPKYRSGQVVAHCQIGAVELAGKAALIGSKPSLDRFLAVLTGPTGLLAPLPKCEVLVRTSNAGPPQRPKPIQHSCPKRSRQIEPRRFVQELSKSKHCGCDASRANRNIDDIIGGSNLFSLESRLMKLVLLVILLICRNAAAQEGCDLASSSSQCDKRLVQACGNDAKCIKQVQKSQKKASKQEARIEAIRHQFPQLTADKVQMIANHQIFIGMTVPMLYAAWKKPIKVNNTRNASGLHQQAIYETLSQTIYVYIDNGVVSSYQY